MAARPRPWPGLLSILMAATLAACAPRTDRPGPSIVEPSLADDRVVMPDGAKLAIRSWQPATEPRAVIVAVHGFNDYANFFTTPGEFFASQGIVSYAYDQRGFGESPGRGVWAGEDTMAEDLGTIVQLLKTRHPGRPVFILGNSMGGGVALVALTVPKPPAVDGVILVAPAVWGRTTMPWYQRAALWVGSHAAPWMRLTGSSLRIQASDNIEMLRALGRDPLVIKETRIDAIDGLANMMDAALEVAPRLETPALILYGARDQVIPGNLIQQMIRSLPEVEPERRRVAYYENGWHMLLRDLQGPVVWRDILAWIERRDMALPSKADDHAQALIAGERGR